MQNNNLPHSPSAPLDSKNDAQVSCCPSDQNQLQFASSLSVVSTVPLSSHSASSPTCNTNEAASDSIVQMQVSESTDAKRLDVMAKPVDSVTSSTDSQKLQNNHQCNTHSLSENSTETVDDIVNVDKNVQSELSTTLDSENVNKEENLVVNEVQNVINVNKINHTANKESCETLSSDSAKTETVHLTTKSSSAEDDEFKKFSNHSDACNLSHSFSSTVPKTEINKVESDRDVCFVEIKNPPNAQIITINNLPIQPHVIEVPSMQNTPAEPTNTLVRTNNTLEGCSAEVKPLSTVVSSCGSQYLSTRNSVQDTNDVSVCEGRVSPINIPVLATPCNSDTNDKLVNHINKVIDEAPSAIKESLPLFPPKEEMKLSPVEEERKRCMLLSEVPTSTPGPPPSQAISVDLNLSKSSEVSDAASSSESVPIKNLVAAVTSKSVLNEKVVCSKFLFSTLHA